MAFAYRVAARYGEGGGADFRIRQAHFPEQGQDFPTEIGIPADA